MGKPWARTVVAKVTVLRQHEGKGARLRGFEIVAGDCGLGSLYHLLSRGACQDALGALELLWHLGAHGWRVEAVRSAYLGIPEFGSVETGRPRALDEADEAVLALHGRLITVATEHEYFSVPGD